MLAEKTVGFTTNPRNHPLFKRAVEMFNSVVLTKVVLTISQLVVPASNAPFNRQFFKFGMVPRDIVFLDEDTNTGVVAYIPHLFGFSTSGSPQDVVHTWGQGGTPFPPGLQLEMNVAEINGKYPCAFVGFASQLVSKSTTLVLSMSMEFTIECKGQNFGMMA